MNEFLAGVLFITGTIAGILSITPVIDSPDYLIKASAHADQVIKGAIFQLIMSAAYVGFAVLLYSVLNNYHQGLAIGFAGFSLVAGTFNVVGVYVMLQILKLSRIFAKTAPSGLSGFQTKGEKLQARRDLVNHVLMILAQSIGWLMLLYVLYQSRLVPSWLPIWGFIGTALAIAASLAVLFHRLNVKTPAYISLNLPLVLQQMVLAGWLIITGFSLS